MDFSFPHNQCLNTHSFSFVLLRPEIHILDWLVGVRYGYFFSFSEKSKPMKETCSYLSTWSNVRVLNGSMGSHEASKLHGGWDAGMKFGNLTHEQRKPIRILERKKSRSFPCKSSFSRCFSTHKSNSSWNKVVSQVLFNLYTENHLKENGEHSTHRFGSGSHRSRARSARNSLRSLKGSQISNRYGEKILEANGST